LEFGKIMPRTPPVSLDQLAGYPRMTRWFEPGLLVKLAWRVAVSELFGQYADGRLMVAALDAASASDFYARARAHLPDGDDAAFFPDEDGALWIDYVADLGDGFDATYAIASILARETLVVGEHETLRGKLLVMGGDEVYPTASLENYQRRLRDPYDWAFPDPAAQSDKGPLVYAIPGNHDWYDGLVLFLGLFTRKERLHLGGWRSRQSRSYFALQLTPDWWLWAVDAQLDDTIDQPQRDYFAAIAKELSLGARVILCGPEPGWLYTRDPGSMSLTVYDTIGGILAAKRPDAKIVCVLSGDTHHYSRYRGETSGVQFITSGGGGAFLESTHQARSEIALNRGDPAVTLDWTPDATLRLTRDSANGAESLYPQRKESRAMLRGLVLFSWRNPDFVLAMGAVYALFHGLGGAIGHAPSTILAFLVATWFFYDYTRRQEGARLRVGLISVVNGAAHAGAFAALALTIERLVPAPWAHAPLVSALAQGAAMLVAGSLVAGTLFGLYLYVSSRFLDLNHNDAFAAMRRDSHRHFLRIRIKDDEATIFPIGLDRTPKRRAWRANPKPSPDAPGAYVAEPPLAPRLIETPIVIHAPRA
jgi:hypothetical protein